MRRYGLSPLRPFQLARAAWQRWSALVACERKLRASATRCSLREQALLVSSSAWRQTEPIFAMQKGDELASFLERVAPLAPATVMEVGTASGGTFFMLTRVASEDALLVSVDLPGGEFGGGYSVLRLGIYPRFARVGQRVRLLRGDSHTPKMQSRVRQALAGASLDLLLLDGDHTLDGVRRDFEAYAPLVRRGGIIALHDIVAGTDADNRVPEFWAELKGRFPVEEFVSDPAVPGYGIGILEWSG